VDKETGHEACADKGREYRDDAERHRRDETRRELKLKTQAMDVSQSVNLTGWRYDLHAGRMKETYQIRTRTMRTRGG
jgi:carbonic anhydrase